MTAATLYIIIPDAQTRLATANTQKQCSLGVFLSLQCFISIVYLARRAVPLRYVAGLRHAALAVAVNQPSLFVAPNTTHVAHPPSLTAVLLGAAQRPILTAVPEAAVQRPISAVPEGAVQRPVLTAALTDAAQRPILSAAPPTAVLVVHTAAVRGSAAYPVQADQQEQSHFLFQLKQIILCFTSLNQSMLFTRKWRLNPRHGLERLLMLIKSYSIPYSRGKLLYSVAPAIRTHERN